MMPKIKEVTVSSKRTMKIKDEYISFDASFVASVEDLAEKEIDSYMAKLYGELNHQIDLQAEDFIKASM